MDKLKFHANEVEAFMPKMNVIENPLLDEPPSLLEKRNDYPYWCRDNPLFAKDFDDPSDTGSECGLKQIKQHIDELLKGYTYECFTFDTNVVYKVEYHDANYLEEYEYFQFLV